jgi:hypothetical protein
MSRRLAVVALLLVGALAGGTQYTLAKFTDQALVGANTLSTATLQPPTGLAAVAACDNLLSFKAKITLTWTTVALADGYDIYRSTTSGSGYALITHVSPGSTASYVDHGLNTNTNYYYVLQSSKNNWRSVNSSQASAHTPGLCL